MKIKIGFFSVMLFLSLLLSHSYFALSAFLAVMLHELGHLFAAKFRNIRLRECKISIYGAGLIPESSCFSYKDEIVLCAFGPLVNFLSAIICIPLYLSSHNEIIYYFSVSSLSLGVLNILPIKDFDGGRILYSLLCLFNNSIIAEKVLKIISFIFIFSLWCLSIYLLLIANSSLSIFIFSLSLFVKIFINEWIAF